MPKPIVATTLSATAVFAVAAVLAAPPADTPDLATLPPPPAQLHKQLTESKTTLAQAIEIAQKDTGGLASLATMKFSATPPAIEVVVYSPGKAQRVTIDPASGSVLAKADIPQIPGEPIAGELQVKPSGAKYFDIKVGEGEEVAAGGSLNLQAQITGYLVDGREFFSTKTAGQPADIQVKRMFPGFVDGIAGMKVGGKRKLVLSPDLAYGPNGNPPTIPGNATLIFDIELLSMKDWGRLPATLPGDPVQGDPTTLPSGLKFYDLKVGDGPQPASPQSEVTVHYSGWLVDGTKFDSSVDRGEPSQFPLSGVIRGWTEGVGSMKVGGKRKLIVPADLAYGDNGRPSIPGGATLVFDVELISVSDKPQ